MCKQLPVILVLLITVGVIMAVGCESGSSRPRTLVILDVYESDTKANDGVVMREWRTLCALEDSSRVVIYGKLGSVGDTIPNMRFAYQYFDFERWEYTN